MAFMKKTTILAAAGFCLVTAMSAIFLGESIQIGQIAGGLVIVAGILIARHERKSHPRAAIA